MCGSERTYLAFVAELRANAVAGDGGDPTPPGVLYRCENKRVAEKGFCNTMKTKARCPEGDAEMHACVELAQSLEKRVEPGLTVRAAWQSWRKIPDGKLITTGRWCRLGAGGRF